MCVVSALGIVLNNEVPPLGIEILPGDASAWLPEGSNERPFLFEERNLGIPSKVLYRAYLEAVHIFAEARRTWHPISESNKTALIHSSSVILLANPAHQTALNARKRFVLSKSLHAEVDLCFNTALLSLPDASKQSIVWHHRRWLLRRLRNPTSPLLEAHEDTLDVINFSVEDLRQEFSIASRASEPSSSLLPSHHDLNALLMEECGWIKTWIDRHISDYTAMQYACQIFSIAAGMGKNNLSWASPPPDMSPDALLDIQGLRTHAQSLLHTYPERESLWMYFRDTFQMTGSPQERLDARSVVWGLVDFIRELLDTSAADSGQGTSALDKYDSINLHVCRFLAWLARQSHAIDMRPQNPLDILRGRCDYNALLDTLLTPLPQRRSTDIIPQMK
ncbi:unnamed protein product [Somion occarium]|uniref:Uncharacterized protein n=1 Tax=Somion occarium TaxID=3059160 RepID=A0ABP1DUB1_9APHY